jgi:hypothetical protein
MIEITIPCPQCGQSFELTEALAAPLLESERHKAAAEAERRLRSEREAIAAAATAAARKETAAEVASFKRAAEAKDAELAKARDAELAARTAMREASEAKARIEVEVARRVGEAIQSATLRARTEAADQFTNELKAAKDEIRDKNRKLAEAEAAEIAARRAKREAEEAKHSTELLVECRLDAERAKARDAAIRERDEDHRLKLADKDRQLTELRDKLEEARRKADQGSEVCAGDVLELDLFEALQRAFPMDLLERVRKGQRGGDVLHTVRSRSGAVCGRILWETKRTKNWAEAWLAKLREDQREASADVAALATETLPPDIEAFGERDGVWVTSLATMLPVAELLRHALIEITTARRAGAFADSQKDRIHSYLIGPQFRQRMSGVAEAYSAMREELDKEKRATVKQWSSREQHLSRILLGMSGVYGDLYGIVGASLPAVEGLALPEPEAASSDTAEEHDPDDREVA